MAPSQSRRQSTAATPARLAPPQPRRKSERGVVKSVLLTFFFHVAALGFGLALLLLLALTVGGLGLVLLCICSGSSRSVRVLVASLWRTELWINSLGVDQAKRENAALDAQWSDGHAHFEDMARTALGGGGGGGGGGPVDSSGTGASRPSLSRSASRIGSGPAQRGREVTPSVMVLSLMYFLLFKWIFNVIFSSIPLIFWIIAIGTLTPINTETLHVELDLSQSSSSGAQYFVGIAVAFLAHQISATAAIGSVFVSEKMAGFLFEEARREDEVGTYAPLLHWSAGQGEHQSHMYQYNSVLNTQSLFDARPPFTASQSMPASYQNPFDNGLGNNQQQRLSRNVSEFNRRTVPGPTMSLPESGPARLVGQRPPVPPIPPFPPFPPAMPFGARPNNNLEAAYRGQAEERVLDCCLFKVHVKRVHDDEGPGGRGGGGRGGHGGGFHGRGGGRDGGRGRGGGRGGIRLETREHGNEYSFRLNIGSSDCASQGEYSSVEPHASARGHGFGSSNRFECGDDFTRSRKQPERHELKRTKSFDSLYVTTVGDQALELPPHMRMYEVLDLSPSAPPLHHWSFPSRRDRFSRSDADLPLAQLAPDQIPPYAMGQRDLGPFYPPPSAARLQIRKSNSDEGRYLTRMTSMDQVQRDGRGEQQPKRDQMPHRKSQMEQQHEQRRRQIEQAQLQQIQADRQREQADRQRQHTLWQREQDTGRPALPKKDQAQRTQSLPGINVQSTPSPASSYMREREVYARERDFHHDGITQAAMEGIEKAKIEEEKLVAFGVLSRAMSAGSRTRARPVSSGSSIAQEPSAVVTDTQFVLPRSDQRRISFTGPYQAGASDVSDYEIRDQFGSLPQTFEEDSYLDAFLPPGHSSSETITTLSEPHFRSPAWGNDPSYNAFSPPGSPTSTSNGSFLLGASTPYDLYSPTNSATQDDDDFPSDQLPQVYRSIRYNPPPPRVLPTSRFAEFDDVPGRRDKVHFNAFAPPSVAPSPKPFHYTVWAFLLSQRDEMCEKAEAFDPVGRKLTVDTKVDIRRGALVHVTLEMPEGFRIVNGGATQGFPWEGKVCSATFDVQCTDGAEFGRVLFKATIIVGTEVAVMRSYVTVSTLYLDPADLEAQMLDSKLEVLEKTFQEIPYKELEMKELVGKGYFGDAYRASYQGQDVVVKTIRASEFGETNDQILHEFQHEAAVLNMFGHHPCVVPFVGASTDIRYPLSVVTKYLPYGSLEDNLRQPNAGEKFSIRQKTAMLKDAAAGLLNIHEGGFIHRDIAARNCLVDENLRVKICDFGLCRRVSAGGGSLMKDTVGPVKYMAPESLQPPHLFSYDSDAYMFGVLMWETYTMSSPFAAMTPVEAMLKVMDGERLAVPDTLPESLRSLMETCFHETPAQRPSMFEILSTLEATVSVSSSKAAIAAVAAASASLSSATPLRQDRSIWI